MKDEFAQEIPSLFQILYTKGKEKESLKYYKMTEKARFDLRNYTLKNETNFFAFIIVLFIINYM